jgi:TetR/AcrR family transcriptional regulator, transcriptional repressor for nem operon
MTEIRDAILNAAEERIRLAGYSGFSFREIAADVGVKSSSVHYHFPSKEKLAAAVARRYTDRLLEAVEAQIEGGRDIVKAWRQVFWEALVRDARMCLCGAMATTSHDLPQDVRDEVKRFFILGIERLVDGGLQRDAAVQVLVTLEGAMLAANLLDDHSLFEAGSAALPSP